MVISAPGFPCPADHPAYQYPAWPQHLAHLGQAALARRSSRCTLSVAGRSQGRAVRGHPHARMPLRGTRLTPAPTCSSHRPTNRTGGRDCQLGVGLSRHSTTSRGFLGCEFIRSGANAKGGLAPVAPSYDLMYTLARRSSQSFKLEG